MLSIIICTINRITILQVMEKVNVTFYHDSITKSAITHAVNKRGISEFVSIGALLLKLFKISKIYFQNNHF